MEVWGLLMKKFIRLTLKLEASGGLQSWEDSMSPRNYQDFPPKYIA